MNHDYIINAIKQSVHTEKADTEPFRLYKLTPNPDSSSNLSTRLVLIIGNADTSTQIKVIEDIASAHGFAINIEQQGKQIDTLNNFGHLELWHSWRGRILRASDVRNDSAFSDKLLQSFWRIIIDQRQSLTPGFFDYFTRHELYPCFNYPGYCTPGLNQWENSLKDSLKFIMRFLNDELDKLILVCGKQSSATKLSHKRIGDMILNHTDRSNIEKWTMDSFNKEFAHTQQHNP